VHVHCFFFSSRRRHTRSKRDWSSDVCSSDLGSLTGADWQRLPIAALAVAAAFLFLLLQARALNLLLMGEETAATLGLNLNLLRKIGRASCRERVESAAGG